ncbi:MAG: response regulator [Bacteroidetes bacterium]|nr:response regulator [Bacteroidota bacterium]
MENLNIKRASVIIIENNYIDTLVLRARLGKYFNLCIAPDLELAEKIISEFNFDMIVTDTNSCKRRSWNLKDIKTKSKNKDIKVCGLSASYKNKDFLINAGVNDVLTKPVCKEDVFNILNWSMPENYNFSTLKGVSTLCSVF